MGEGQSKRSAQTAKSSVATGDMSAQDLTALHQRCLPKGLRNMPAQSPKKQADAPVAVPPAPSANFDLAWAISKAKDTIGGSTTPRGEMTTPQRIVGGTNLPRSSSMLIMTKPDGTLPRSSSMVRTSGVHEASFPRSSSMVRTTGLEKGSMTVPMGNMPRSNSMIVTYSRAEDNAAGPIIATMPRSSSMVRTTEQMAAAIKQNAPVPIEFVPAGPYQRMTSPYRPAAQQQEAFLTKNAPVPVGSAFIPTGPSPAMQRADSLHRSSAQQDAYLMQKPPSAAAGPSPALQRASSLHRSSAQQDAFLSQSAPSSAPVASFRPGPPSFNPALHAQQHGGSMLLQQPSSIQPLLQAPTTLGPSHSFNPSPFTQPFESQALTNVLRADPFLPLGVPTQMTGPAIMPTQVTGPTLMASQKTMPVSQTPSNVPPKQNVQVGEVVKEPIRGVPQVRYTVRAPHAPSQKPAVFNGSPGQYNAGRQVLAEVSAAVSGQRQVLAEVSAPGQQQQRQSAPEGSTPGQLKPQRLSVSGEIAPGQMKQQPVVHRPPPNTQKLLRSTMNTRSPRLAGAPTMATSPQKDMDMKKAAAMLVEGATMLVEAQRNNDHKVAQAAGRSAMEAAGKFEPQPVRARDVYERIAKI